MTKYVAQNELLKRIRGCKICTELPLGANPIVQFSSTSKLLIVGQAPGRITHNKGIPFDDPSGERLRAWLGIDRSMFYDSNQIAIVPMGFCFPGTGKSGDLPPRAECAPAWRNQILNALKSIELTVILGRYAIDWHLPSKSKSSVTELVRSWQNYWPEHIVLPHPSPRNNRWLKQNPFFEAEIIPILQLRIQKLLAR